MGQSTDDCILWPYGLFTSGHGRIVVDGRDVGVHALACTHAHGPAPEGHEACHGPCHTPACFNPRHLSWQTRAQNNADRERDGTVPYGERHPLSKLTSDAVLYARERRAAGVVWRIIAEEAGVASTTVRQAVNGQTWKHMG